MRDVPVRFNISLRTGFFKTEPYVVTVSRKELIFTHADEVRGAAQFRISWRDVQSVIIFGNFPTELEIRTAKEVFTGTFRSRADVAEAVASLRAVFGNRFLNESFT